MPPLPPSVFMGLFNRAQEKDWLFMNFYVGLISVHNGPYIAPFTLYIKQYISTPITMIITIRLHFY